MDINKQISAVKHYFNLRPDMEEETVIIQQINAGISFRGANLWVLTFAIFIASLGLNVNSTAVIIGAMLISPLMGPIIGMGFAIGTNDIEMLRRAGRNFAVATLISILTAMVYFLITPISDAQSELLARTSPTIYDVLIATMGGAAGFTALCTKGKGNVIPGVAIATALMPPLCTAGYGLATGNFLYFLGAFYLFFINTVFITISTYLGARLMKFSKKQFLKQEKEKRAMHIIWSVVLVTVIPAIIMTYGIIKQGIFENNVRNFLKTEVAQNGTELISSNAEKDSLVLHVVAVGKEITRDRQLEAQARMQNYGMKGYRLNLIQGGQTDSLFMLGSELANASNSLKDNRQQVVELSARLNATTQELDSYKRYANLTQTVRKEMATLFPQVSKFSLSKVTQADRDSATTQQFVMAAVTVDNKNTLNASERKKLQRWLKERTSADSLVLYVTN